MQFFLIVCTACQGANGGGAEQVPIRSFYWLVRTGHAVEIEKEFSPMFTPAKPGLLTVAASTYAHTGHRVYLAEEVCGIFFFSLTASCWALEEISTDVPLLFGIRTVKATSIFYYNTDESSRLTQGTESARTRTTLHGEK